MKLKEKIVEKLGYVSKEEMEKRILEIKSASLASTYVTARGSSGVVPEMSYAQLVDAYKSWVYTCIDKIAKSVAMIPLKLFVYRRKGHKIIDLSWRSAYKNLVESDKKYFLKDMDLEREEIYDHPFLTLINRPNHFMTRFMLWYETMIRLELGGMCGWYKINNRLAIPEQIWPLPLTKFAKLTPQISPTLVLEHWNYQDGSINQQFKPDEVLLIKYPHPASPFLPMSPLMAQAYPYDLDLFLMQQQRSLFQHGALPGLHLTTDQNLTPDQVKELKSQIDSQFAGALKSGETLITHSGLNANKLGQTGREAMIGTVANYARDKLITSFDLSPGKVGLVTDVNRANAESLNWTYINECLKPKCMLIEEVLEAFLLPVYDEGLTCDFSLPDFGDKDFRVRERESNLQNYYTSINEERNKEGKEPVSWGDRPWVSFTETQVPGNGKPSINSGAKLMGTDFWTEERKDVAWKLFVRKIEKLEQLFLLPLKQHFRNQSKEVIRRLGKEGKKIVGQYQGWSRQKMQQHLKSNGKAIDNINIDIVEERKRLTVLFTPIVKTIMKKIGDERLKDLMEVIKATSFEFNVNDPRVLKYLGRRMETFSQSVAGTTFDEIESILREGFSEGLPIPTIAGTLREKFESWDQYRAPLIARTETISATNEADLEAVHQSGLEEKLLKHWLTAGDENVRETHVKAGRDYEDGIPIDEEFRVGADLMQAPGGGSDPGENINCRCTLYYTEIEEE